jgi:hypothetical protein
MYVTEAERLVGSDGVVIIDSFSHAWSNEGGVLEEKEKIASSGRPGMNGYTAWNEAGRIQNNLVNSILSTNCHTIVTMRSKMDYILVENEKGKKEPRRVGLAPVQRDDTEYEFDIVFDIDRSHKARTTKDTTIFDDLYDVLTPEIGVALQAWLDMGVEPPLKPKCGICGGTIAATQTKKVEDIITGTIEKMGGPACMACYSKWVRDNAAASVSG